MSHQTENYAAYFEYNHNNIPGVFSLSKALNACAFTSTNYQAVDLPKSGMSECLQGLNEDILTNGYHIKDPHSHPHPPKKIFTW